MSSCAKRSKVSRNLSLRASLRFRLAFSNRSTSVATEVKRPGGVFDQRAIQGHQDAAA
jgi:hypothetical protein